MVITLIGYRGCGKSSVAVPLAARLDWYDVDADNEIECLADKSIAEIFAEEGEARFRELERSVMKDLLGREELVIAAGGGAVLNEDTRKQLQQAGPVVWLTADVDVLAERIGCDDTTSSRRPNLTATGGRAEIERLLTEREPLYRECASYIIDSSLRTPDQLVDEIIAAIGPLVGKED